ncbi:endonuclease/exonuclease/phosphatase family protein [Streptococcus sciuri]|uniref:Endonuclease/exonuclease/phosphatase family protein n=1 Tax=Streptococcus sciuri TaxID=2973939 RepID=A0ABT2F5Y7_9STRE|nr:endonuclease/exonuclease/phosphatase family protein [Streptococcus sciuri]MCS4487864.1 endonuclease/exonuclease/phosphatase family protein [Streptococcus sciuri]
MINNIGKDGTKVLTLNTHSWLENNPLEKLAKLADDIATNDYNLICLQEINQEMTSQVATSVPHYQALKASPAIHVDNYALLLILALLEKGKTYYWSWAYNHIGYDKYHEGVAILSKQPIEVFDILVSDVNEEADYHTRRALAVKTELNQKSILAVSVHLSWWNKGFQGEWKKLEDALLAKEMPVLIMGDFNNPYGYEGYQMVLDSKLDLRDSHTVASEISGNHTIKANIDGWEGNKKALKVDYIFTNLDTPIKSSQIVFNGNSSPVLSDHFGVTASW